MSDFYTNVLNSRGNKKLKLLKQSNSVESDNKITTTVVTNTYTFVGNSGIYQETQDLITGSKSSIELDTITITRSISVKAISIVVKYSAGKITMYTEKDPMLISMPDAELLGKLNFEIN